MKPSEVLVSLYISVGLGPNNDTNPNPNPNFNLPPSNDMSNKMEMTPLSEAIEIKPDVKVHMNVDENCRILNSRLHSAGHSIDAALKRCEGLLTLTPIALTLTLTLNLTLLKSYPFTPTNYHNLYPNSNSNPNLSNTLLMLP
jgi:hypothetical protein